MRKYDDVFQFSQELAKSPITRGCAAQIEFLARSYGNDYTQLAERILAQIYALDLDSNKLFTKYIIDYLKEMASFLKTGSYCHSDFASIKSSIYDNDDVMTHTYLPGLFLAYGFTTILFAKYRLFKSSFLPQINAGSRGIEVGFGEGFYLWELSHAVPGISLRGVDISPSAIAFTRRLLTAAGLHDFCLDQGDVLQGIDAPSSSMDWCIFAEIIEHIPSPEKGIAEIARLLKPGGIMYLTTVIDSNHMDHIVNFESPAFVEGMIVDCGFSVQDKVVYRIQDDFKDSPDRSIGLAFVCKRNS